MFFNRIKIKKGVTLKVIKNNTNTIEIIIKNKKSTVPSTTIHLKECPKCETWFIPSVHKTCPTCDKLLKLINIFDKSLSKKQPQEKRCRKIYHKGDGIKPITILNLNDLHERIKYFSKAKLATLLKCAILKMNVSEIADKLKLSENSVIRDYARLKQIGLVTQPFVDSYRVTEIVSYNQPSIKTQTWLENQLSNAYSYLSKIKRNNTLGFTVEDAINQGFKHRTITNYIYVVSKFNLLEKIKLNGITYYKLKRRK